jgi:hypothetical protein
MIVRCKSTFKSKNRISSESKNRHAGGGVTPPRISLKKESNIHLSSMKLFTFIALFAFTLARKNCKNDPKTVKPTYPIGPKLCLEMNVSCDDRKCESGYECGVMSSDTHCDTPICVLGPPMDAGREGSLKDDVKCPKCPNGEECGKIKIWAGLDTPKPKLWFNSICVSQDKNKLPRAEPFKPKVCPAVLVSCDNVDCVPGQQCRVMSSETHCDTEICVPESLLKSGACPDECPSGEECADIRGSGYFQNMCVPKDETELLNKYAPPFNAV